MMSLQRRICLDEYDADYFPDASFVPFRGDDTYRLKALKRYSEEYASVSSKIDANVLEVIRIDRIENKFLKKCFELKKIQNPEFKEMQLFHLTTKKSADEICKHNFNWRMSGTRTNHHSFGKGVYFSDSAEYPCRFKQRLRGENVLFVVDVLVGNICQGKRTMHIPEEGINASVKNLNKFEEVVMYHDNEFYPSYKITVRPEMIMRAETNIQSIPQITVRPEMMIQANPNIQSIRFESKQSKEDDAYSSESEDDEYHSEIEDAEDCLEMNFNSKSVSVYDGQFKGNHGFSFNNSSSGYSRTHDLDDSYERDVAGSSSNVGIALGATAAVIGIGLLGLFLYKKNKNKKN